VKLTFDDGVEEFREEFLAWLDEHRPSPAEMEAEPVRSSAHLPGWARSWIRRQFDDGWLVPGWPKELGGREAGPVETLVYLEEMARAQLPRSTNPQGLGIVAPSILDYGSEDQIAEYAMPILRGERAACLGMSEPGAGSDLASLSTRAELDGDHFVVNGQKVWTSGANYADFCFLFCRTDPTVPKHQGISVLLVEMETPGVVVRPLPEMIDPQHPDLNEVFFTDVVVPREHLVGTMNNGWAMANGSLAHERGMVWLNSVLMLEEDVKGVLHEARTVLGPMPRGERDLLADRVVQSYIDSVAARCLGYRGFAKLVRGGSAPEQALMKVFTSEANQRLALSAAELLGDRQRDPGSARGYGASTATWVERYFQTFGGTISAGSSEIQRNIIAEKVLGLPRG
jgi:alkylation response protein AidB-like acyl-CoA dehydrogenase